MHEMMMTVDGRGGVSVPTGALGLKVIKSSSESLLKVYGRRTVMKATFDVPGTVNRTFGETGETFDIAVPTDAEYVFVEMDINPVGVITPVFRIDPNTRVTEVIAWGDHPDELPFYLYNNTALVQVPMTSPPWTNWSTLFTGCSQFNQDISMWSTSHATTMMNMFYLCQTFNQPLNNWDMSNVTNISQMFAGCSVFNQPLNNWDTSNVTNMSGLFNACPEFNQPLNNWNVSNVTTMANTFGLCTKFNQDLSGWNTGKVTTMSGMFNLCMAYNRPMNTWDTSKLTSTFTMFQNAAVFNQPLNNWNVGNVTSMNGMFQNATVFNQNLSNLTFPKVTLANRSGYDGGATAWLTPNKPNFAIKT